MAPSWATCQTRNTSFCLIDSQAIKVKNITLQFSIIGIFEFGETESLSTRPLSPHLQVYRPQITSVLSILHRITGVIIALGAIVISLWIESVARGDPWYGSLSDLLVSPLGKILMIIWTLCTAYHLCNGIRHLAWDIGYGFEIPQVYRTGKLVVVFAIIITAGVWWI